MKYIELEITNALTEDRKVLTLPISYMSESPDKHNSNVTWIDFQLDIPEYHNLMRYVCQTKYIINCELQGISNTKYEYRINNSVGARIFEGGVFVILSQEMDFSADKISNNPDKMTIHCAYTGLIQIIDERVY